MENIKVITRKLLTMVLVSSIAQISFAQTDSSLEPDQPAANSSTTIASGRERPTEEIIVTEQLPLYRLREMTVAAEDKVYDLFNELVDEKRFRISCDTEKRINSLFNFRECKPEFEREATRAEAQDHLAMFRTTRSNPGELPSGSVSGGIAVPQQFSIPMQHKELQKKMQTLARENPEFLQSLIEFVEAKERMENYERLNGSDE